MTKKIAILTGISASAFFFAQDISTIRNTTEVYDNSSSITGSARYTAMAGSMGALGGEISTVATNPAGIGVAIASDINASLLINSTKTTTTLAGRSIENSIDNVNLGQLGGVLSFATENGSPWKFINIGFNLSNEKIGNTIQSAGNSNIKNDYSIGGVLTDYLVYSGHQYERIGTRSKLNIAVGGNYDNKIYIGAGVNISSLDIEQYDEAFISSENGTIANTYFSRINTPFNEDASGFSISAGIIGKINQQFRIGASLETPTWYSVDREYVGYTPHSETSISSSVYSETRNLRTPGKLTLSGAFIPNKHFAFNIDYRVDLGKPHFSGGEAEKQLNDFYKDSYKAQNEVRLSGEFRYQGFRARAGYAFTTSPFKNYTNPNGTIDANGNTLTGVRHSNYIVGKSQTIAAGLGYDFKSFYVDATYQHITQDYTNPFLDGIYVYSNTTKGYYTNSSSNIVSDTKTKKGNIILTLGWKF